MTTKKEKINKSISEEKNTKPPSIKAKLNLMTKPIPVRPGLKEKISFEQLIKLSGRNL